MNKAFLLLALQLACTGPLCAGLAVVGNLARNHTAQPGGTFEGIILLKNTADQTLDVQVFQTDYLFYADGRNLYEKPGTAPRSNAEWLAVSSSHLSIPPRETVSVHYRGSVPDQSALAGTYWSMIMVEPSPPPFPEVSSGEDKITMAMRTVTRYGIQVITELDAAAREELRIADRAVVARDGQRFLQLDVENVGDKAQIPMLWMELFNHAGISIGRFDGGKWRIFPGCSARFSVALAGIPAGNYTALVVLDSGGDHVTGAQYQLEIQ